MDDLPNAPFCGTCGARMRPLWGAKWFCPRECDLPVERRTRKLPSLSARTALRGDSEDFSAEEDTQPLRCPVCASALLARFPTARALKSHCWDCGKVF